jgi:putative oxidoreductase
LLRLACAAAFPYRGSANLFSAFDGPGPQSFSAFLHAPAIIGHLVGLAEVAGGLAILTRVLFRVGAACIITVMIGAIFLVHISHGFKVGKGGFEYAFAQLLIAFSRLLTGPGAYSLAGILQPPLRKLSPTRSTSKDVNVSQNAANSGDRCRGQLLGARVLQGPCHSRLRSCREG